MPTWNTNNKSVEVTCPKCQLKFKQAISLRKVQQDVICPSCGANILVKSEGGKSIKDQTDAAIKNALKKAGLK